MIQAILPALNLCLATKSGKLEDDEGGSNASYSIDDPDRRSEDIESYSDNMMSDENSQGSEKHVRLTNPSRKLKYS